MAVGDFDYGDWHQWRGGVDARIAQYERTIDSMAKDSREIKETLSGVSTLLTALSTRFQDRVDDRKTVSMWQVALVSSGIAGVFAVIAQIVGRSVH